MRNLSILLSSVLLRLLVFNLTSDVFSQSHELTDERWDSIMIEEAFIWSKLTKYYPSADGLKFWEERKTELHFILDNYSESQWVDDAALLLAGGKASFESDITGAVSDIRSIINLYPESNTVIRSWSNIRGCKIDESWLMHTSGLITFNNDGTIRATHALNIDNPDFYPDREVFTYFDHQQKHPHSTKDVAQLVLAQMLIYQNDIPGAIDELEELLSRNTNLYHIRFIDSSCAAGQFGFLIRCTPPSESSPLWRTPLYACTNLISLYQISDQREKADSLALHIGNQISFDGYYWNFNRYIGSVLEENEKWEEAAEQFKLSLQGLSNLINDKARRMEILHNHGYLLIPEDFQDWGHEAEKPYLGIISNLNRRIINLESNLR